MENYSKEYYCRNCNESFMATFKFGEVAHKPACPHCGVSDSQLDRERMSMPIDPTDKGNYQLKDKDI